MHWAERTALVAAAFLALASPAQAETLKFAAMLAGDEADAQRLGDARGNVSFTLDTASKALSWTIEYSGLAQPPDAVRCGMLESQTGPALVITGDMKSPINGSKTIGDVDVGALSAGRWVCVLGTSGDAAELGGEVRPAR